jgi:putative ABC transport system ATP-binding protein
MSLDHGERIGLVGKSGSGKSSLLRAIARLDLCDDGRVSFRGREVSRDAIPGFRRQVIYLPQKPVMFAGSVRENFQIPFRLTVSPQRYDESIIMQLLHFLQKPTGILDQSAESLSGGEQQIVALIRAMILSPTVLLLDEPSASLDSDSTGQLEHLVLKWQQSDPDASRSSRALIWSSHNTEQISRMATRVMHIDGGRLQPESAG